MLNNQIEKPDEIIVVGVKNDVETVNFVEKVNDLYQNINAFFISRRGIVPQENKGLSEADGDIVCFIDDDGYPAEDWILRIRKSFLENQELGAVGGPSIPCPAKKPIIQKTNLVGKILWFGYFIGNTDKLTDEATYVDHLGGCNMAFRRELIDSFDERFIGDAHMFEADACLSIKEKGYTIIYDPYIRVYHYGARVEARQKDLPSTIIYAHAHNRTFLFLKHLLPMQKLVFMFFDFIIGEPSAPGLLLTLVKSLLRGQSYLTRELVPSIRGKTNGLGSYLDLITNKVQRELLLSC